MQIPGFPGYELERTGPKTWRIISYRVNSNGRLLQGHTWADGRIFYNLVPESNSVWAQGSRAAVNRQLAFYVLLALEGPPPRPGMLAGHLDQDPGNNSPENLHWITYDLNVLERFKPPTKKFCRRGHDASKLRYSRPNGRASSCKACQMASRLLLVDEPLSAWPSLLQPGNEDALVEWMNTPRSKREPMGLMSADTRSGG